MSFNSLILSHNDLLFRNAHPHLVSPALSGALLVAVVKSDDSENKFHPQTGGAVPSLVSFSDIRWAVAIFASCSCSQQLYLL